MPPKNNDGVLKWVVGVLLTIVFGLVSTLYAVSSHQTTSLQDRLDKQEDAIVILRESNAENRQHLNNIDTNIAEMLKIIRERK